MTLDKICMWIKRVGMEVLSIFVLFFFSSPTNSSRMSDLKPATLRHGEREANSGSNRRETSSFLLLPVLFFYFIFYKWIPMKRRPATTPIDGHAQGYFTAPFAQPLLSLSTSNTRLLCGLCLHTHNYGTVSSPAVRSSIWDFLLTKKFLLGDIFQ